jgi:hypothetical protein
MINALDISNEPFLEEIIISQTKFASSEELFLAAGGYYQEEYISLFESIINNSENTAIEPVSDFESDYANLFASIFLNKLTSIYSSKQFNFNKIISVTIPSQIIAKYLLELLEKKFYEDPEITFYSIKNGSEIFTREVPTLIRLSSYYSFDEEINFKNIKSGDRILLINDVISTGNLIEKIATSVSSKTPLVNNSILITKIEKVLTVVDTRYKLHDLQGALPSQVSNPINNICEAVFFENNPNLSESSIISILNKPVIKYKHKPPNKENAKLIRINPILNAPITFPSRYSGEDRIAIKDPDEFLNFIPSSDLKIGHFHQNSLHHTYFIVPKDIFKKDINSGLTNPSGIHMFKTVLDKINIIEQNTNYINIYEVLNNEIDSLLQQNNQIDLNDHSTIEYLRNIKLLINTMPQNIKIKDFINNNETVTNFKVDYVFRPVFSGIELLSKNDIISFCNVPLNNIIELHRFDTLKGWRFIIPPKYLNNSLINKTVLILDMGSFTGDSIIQMVDALSVYQINKIIVISLIGRIEDFDREFFSCIKNIRVKRNNNSHLASSTQKKVPLTTIANLNIYFGTNLHISPYPSVKICKLCNEIEKLENYSQLTGQLSTNILNYITGRKNEIELNHVNEINSICPIYFPTLKSEKSGTHDTHKFYSIRDKLGKIDGYRFYKDFYNYFDELIPGSPTFIIEMETIIAVCLHETHLITCIKNQLPDLFYNLQEFINNIINLNDIDNLYYKWRKQDLLKFHLIINESNLLDNKIISILSFAFNSDNCRDLLIYYIWEKHYDHKKNINNHFKIQVFRDNIFEIKKIFSESYFDLINEIIKICDEFDYYNFSQIDLNFYRLKIFYSSETYHSPDSNILSIKPTTHPSIYNSIYGLETSLNRWLEEPSRMETEIDNFVENWVQKKSRLFNDIVVPLSKVIEYIKFSDIDGDYEFMYSDSFLDIKIIIGDIDKYINSINLNNLKYYIDHILEKIELLLNRYLSVRSKFAIFFSDFLTFSPIDILEKYFISNTFINLKLNPENINKYLIFHNDLSHYAVNIHPLILYCVITEIFNNFTNYGKGGNIIIEDKMISNSYSLIFTQSNPFVIPTEIKMNVANKICFTSLENGILKAFGVKYITNKGDFYDDNENKIYKPFRQEINIPIFKILKNESS